MPVAAAGYLSTAPPRKASNRQSRGNRVTNSLAKMIKYPRYWMIIDNTVLACMFVSGLAVIVEARIVDRFGERANDVGVVRWRLWMALRK